MVCRVLACLLAFAASVGPVSAQPNRDLIRYAFDEGAGSRVSGGIDGTVGARWVASPSGSALAFDGGPESVVSVQIPVPMRIGKGSWSFGVWLKPERFTIQDAQNQRRIFSYGTFPDANLVIDILGSGHVSWYFCYRAPAGDIVSAGGSTAAALALNRWAHVALVCDREKREVRAYIDGAQQGVTTLPQAFDGDFSLSGDVTLGSGWHNYVGVMDEALLTRRALTRAEVKAEFARMAGTFGVTPSPEALAAEKREALMEEFAKSRAAWAAKDWKAVRAACAPLIASQDAPANLRSYAHLRLAQSYAAAGDLQAARKEYVRIAAAAAYPAVHRAEARELAAEIGRALKGLPARDPAATRTGLPAIGAVAAEVLVSPTGSDTADGVRKPVASASRARDIVRGLRRKGVKGPIAVTFRPGDHRVTAPLTLDRRDSGTPGGPVIYRASQPGKARFYGGRRIAGFEPVRDPDILARLLEEARGSVMQCDLRAQGITDYGALAVRGFSQPPSPPTLELFVNGKPMTLARWPNSGFVGIKRLVEPGDRSQGKPSVFEYLDDRHARWTRAEDGWLFGYFRYLWADATIRFTEIDTQARTVSCAEAYQYGPPGMDTGQGIQYYAFNLLEEIDQPGEWYLDRKAGVLYLYPPTDLKSAIVEIGMLSTPMVAAEGVSDVWFRGLTFDLGRYNGLVLNNCRRCIVAGCTVRRMAGNGITVNGGEACMLLGSDVHTIGRRATEVIGGDRATLKPGKHVVENCRIYDFGRIDRTYTPAIQLEGVGNRVAHNLMYDCPSSVMRIEGNDHIIEYNDVLNAVRESDDQGAMELFGNPTYRGVVFRFNRFTNCGKSGVGAAVHGQAAIRLDDVISGILIYGNVFVKSANGNFGAVQINSGRDNIMDNNLFFDCKQGVSGGWYPGNPVWRAAAEKQQPDVLIQSELYLKRYPEMATMLVEPGMNRVWRNVFYRCGPAVTGNRANLDMMANGEWPDRNPGFVRPEAGNWGIKAGSELLAEVGFRPIPFGEIGLYKDALRVTWPAVVKPGPVAEWRR